MIIILSNESTLIKITSPRVLLMAENYFHLFPRLPTELRLEIWRLCLPRRVWELDIPTSQGL
jgi:hypothetical protein